MVVDVINKLRSCEEVWKCLCLLVKGVEFFGIVFCDCGIGFVCCGFIDLLEGIES